MEPRVFTFTDREFLEFWHLSIAPFSRDVDQAEYLAARQWESLAIAQFVAGPYGSAARTAYRQCPLCPMTIADYVSDCFHARKHQDDRCATHGLACGEFAEKEGHA